MTPLFAAIPPPPDLGPLQNGGLELGPLDMRMYGLLIAIGAYLALRLAVSRYERLGGDPEMAERALLIGLGFGLLGARIGYVIPRVGDFLTRPQDILAIWQGGLAIFGGLFLGTLAVVVYLRRKRMDVPAMLTAAAPALPLAQAIGRWGNYFNQELYGRPTDLPWALEVEERYRRSGYQEYATFHPTFLYESLWNLTLFGVLLWLDRRGTLKRGSLIFVYLIGYGIGRGWIEALRIDTAERYFGLSRNNWIALLIIVVGAVGLWWWQRRAEPTTEPTGAVGTTEPTGAVETTEATGTTGAVETTETAGPAPDEAGDEHAPPPGGGGERS